MTEKYIYEIELSNNKVIKHIDLNTIAEIINRYIVNEDLHKRKTSKNTLKNYIYKDNVNYPSFIKSFDRYEVCEYFKDKIDEEYKNDKCIQSVNRRLRILCDNMIEKNDCCCDNS